MLPNAVLEILGGGQMCMSNMLYRIPSPLGEKVAEGRMRGHKGTVASLQRLYVIPQRQTKSALPYWMLVAIQHTPVPSSRSGFAASCGCRRLAGGHSPLLHTRCPLQSNMPRSVIPQRFRCVLRVSSPCGISIGAPLNASGFRLRSRKVTMPA